MYMVYIKGKLMVVKPRQTGIGYNSTINKETTKNPKIRGSFRIVNFIRPTSPKTKIPIIDIINIALLAKLSVFCILDLLSTQTPPTKYEILIFR